MTTTIPGTLTKQGPIATLEGDFYFSGEDRFMFNGSQFVHFIAQVPRAIVASANTVLLLSGGQVLYESSVSSYKNSNGDYRFVDGNPVSDGNDINKPTTSYDHVIVGYNTPITTDTVKFWAEDYIPIELIRIDFSHDGHHFFEVPTHVGNVDFIFEDSLKIYETDDVPSGQYIYTVSLSKQYTAKYWRVRSFIFTYNTDRVVSVDGKNVAVVTTSGLPSNSDEYGSNNFFYNSNYADTDIIEDQTSYGVVADNGDGTYDIHDVTFNTGGDVGTCSAGACVIIVEELMYSYTTVYDCDQELPACPLYCNHPANTVWAYPECWVPRVQQIYLGTNTIYYVETTADFNIPSSSLVSVDITVDGYLPAYSQGQVGPNGGIISIKVRYSLGGGTRFQVLYNSINGNTLEVVGTPAGLGSDLEPGQNFYYSYPMKLTQVRVPERLGPQFRYWESDGSTAVTNTVVLDNVYDVTYDSADGVFYAVRFNETGGEGDPSISEDFSNGAGSNFDTTRWIVTGNGFYRDSDSSRLVFINTVSGTYLSGSLVSKAYFTGDFDTTLLVDVDTLSGTGYYGSVIKDAENDNQVGGVYTVGEWGTIPASRALTAVSLHSLVNATDLVVSFSNFRIDPFNMLEDEYLHTIKYVTSSGWYYTRENINSPGDNELASVFSSPNTSIYEDGFSVTLNNSGQEIVDGSYLSFNTNRVTVSGIKSDSVEMYISYVSSTDEFQFSYDDTVDNDTILTEVISGFGSDFRSDLSGASSNFINVSSTSFSVNGELDSSVPCLEIFTIDINGNLVEVSGVSTPGGVAIQTFDVVENLGDRYEDSFGKISIITTNQTEAQGGSIFIKVAENLYKYNKTILPLTARETGFNAAVLTSGTLPSEYTNGLNYDGYVVGGVSFIIHDEERGGVFLRTVSDSTLLLTGYEAQLDLVSDNTPFARDAVDCGVLYTVEDNDVYLFNANEDSVAFCNVVSSDPILPASSAHSSTITARVVNMFGAPLQGKRVSFSITLGEGSLAPTYGCSTVSGTVSTVFTAASSVGTSIITATASNDSC